MEKIKEKTMEAWRNITFSLKLKWKTKRLIKELQGDFRGNRIAE